MKHDDAKQRLSLKSYDWMSRDQQIASYSILVMYWRVGWWEQKQNQAPTRHEIRIPCKPVILIGSKSVGTTWSGLFKQRWQQPLLQFIRFLWAHAEDSLVGRETDAGSQVAKACAREFKSTPSKAKCSWAACSLHQQNRIVSNLVAALLSTSLPLSDSGDYYVYDD